MSWILPRNRKLKHTLTLLCAMCLAGAATWASHQWIDRRDVPHRLEYGISVIALDILSGRPRDDPGLDAEFFEEPTLLSAFCLRIAERARLFTRFPSAKHDVWILGLHPCRGFPMISRDWTAKVMIDETQDHEPQFTTYHFTAGQDGNPPILYGGLIGNWTFYLVISAAMLYAAEKAVIAIIIRRRQRRHGFPVVIAAEEETASLK